MRTSSGSNLNRLGEEATQRKSSWSYIAARDTEASFSTLFWRRASTSPPSPYLVNSITGKMFRWAVLTCVLSLEMVAWSSVTSL